MQIFTVWGFDLPGHGKTAVLGDETYYRMEAIAASLIQVMDMLAIAPCHLLGYSMGGRLALYLAIHYPQYFQSVILESASPGLKTEQERRDRRQRDHAIAQRLEQENFESFLDWWYGLPLFQTLRAHPTYQEMLARRRHNNPSEVARSLRQMSTGQQPSLWTKLTDLAAPCFWIIGGEDKKFIRIAQQAQAHHPKIQLHCLKSIGHNVHQEAPNDFVSLIQQCLKQKNSMPS